MPDSAPKAAYGTLSRARHEAKIRTHDRMLDATCDLVLTQGVQAATVDRIVKAAGVSRPTFYVHFQVREDVFKALRARMTSNLDEHYDALAALHDAREDQIHSWVCHFLASCRRDRKLVLTLIRSGSVSGVTFDARHYYETVIARLAKGLRRCREAKTDPVTKAKALLLLMQLEALIRYFATKEEADEDAIFARIVASDISSFLQDQRHRDPPAPSA